MKCFTKNIILFLFLFLLSFTITIKTHATGYYSPIVDASLMNSYLAEDESGNDEINKIITYFTQNYITVSMSDFEKEIQIIRYLVETVSFDKEEVEKGSYKITDSYKAYGALINGKAVCSGYAKAFDLLAKASGLSTNIVTGTATNSAGVTEAHAWNQIYLDGDWYNVDVTWEDPLTNIELGSDILFNNYINRTDIEFSKDHVRDNGFNCFATKYGESAVAFLIHMGIVNTTSTLDDLRQLYILNITNAYKSDNKELLKSLVNKFFLLGVKYSNNSNLLEATDTIVNSYIHSHIFNNEMVIPFVTTPNSKDHLNIDNAESWLHNNISIPGNYELQNFFSSDGKLDSRIIIFNAEWMQ